MNANAENMISALAGNSPANGGDDWESKFKELDRKYQQEKVEAGRLRKTNEELEAARKRIAELEGASRTQRAIADIPDEVGGDVPDGFKQTSAMIAQRTVDASMNGLSERMAVLERRNQEEAQSAFARKVEAEHPGFLGDIGPGGKLNAAWNQYLRYNQGSVQEAMGRNDYDTLAYHINMFFRSGIEVPPTGPTGANAAIPDPSASTGGVNGQAVTMSPTKVYTNGEICALYDRIEALRDRGDYAQIRQIEAEISKAQREGRVKG